MVGRRSKREREALATLIRRIHPGGEMEPSGLPEVLREMYGDGAWHRVSEAYAVFLDCIRPEWASRRWIANRKRERKMSAWPDGADAARRAIFEGVRYTVIEALVQIGAERDGRGPDEVFRLPPVQSEREGTAPQPDQSDEDINLNAPTLREGSQQEPTNDPGRVAEHGHSYSITISDADAALLERAAARRGLNPEQMIQDIVANAIHLHLMLSGE